MHEMCHYFGSGTTSEWQSKMVNGIWSGKVASALMKSINGGPIHGDTQHFWPYGINQKEEVTNLGSIAAQQEALAITAKLAKAMLVDDCGLPTNNPSVGIGVYGYDATRKDIYHEVTTVNSWQDVDFTFKTGSLLKSTQYVYFNSGAGYIDNWELYEVSADASLSDIQLNDTSLTGFDAATNTYSIELPYGTTDVPKVTALATDTNATVEISNATVLPGSSTILVTAEDGVTRETYTIAFTIASPLSSDASLSDIQVDGTSIDGFSATTLTYDIELPDESADMPVITATASDPNATVKVTDVSALPGAASIEVTAEDGKSQQTYTINFTVATGILNVDNSSISVYPTVSSSSFIVETEFKSSIVTVYTLTGNLVKSQFSNDNQNVVTVPKAGVYILKVTCNGINQFFRVVKVK